MNSVISIKEIFPIDNIDFVIIKDHFFISH